MFHRRPTNHAFLAIVVQSDRTVRVQRSAAHAYVTRDSLARSVMSAWPVIRARNARSVHAIGEARCPVAHANRIVNAK